MEPTSFTSSPGGSHSGILGGTPGSKGRLRQRHRLLFSPVVEKAGRGWKQEAFRNYPGAYAPQFLLNANWLLAKQSDRKYWGCWLFPRTCQVPQKTLVLDTSPELELHARGWSAWSHSHSSLSPDTRRSAQISPQIFTEFLLWAKPWVQQ